MMRIFINRRNMRYEKSNILSIAGGIMKWNLNHIFKNIEELQKEFDVDIHAGLSVEEAEKKNIYGENALKQTEKNPFFRCF